MEGCCASHSKEAAPGHLNWHGLMVERHTHSNGNEGQPQHQTLNDKNIRQGSGGLRCCHERLEACVLTRVHVQNVRMWVHACAIKCALVSS